MTIRLTNYLIESSLDENYKACYYVKLMMIKKSFLLTLTPIGGEIMAKKIDEIKDDFIKQQVRKCHEEGKVATLTEENKCSNCGLDNIFESNFCGGCGCTFVTLE